jgi:hypothetical protein
MDRKTLSTLLHLDEPLSLAMASSLECSTFAARDPHGRQGVIQDLYPDPTCSSFGDGMSEGFAHVRLGSPSP